MSLETKQPTSCWPEAVAYIPNGCQTMSKCPDRYVNGVYPKMLVSGFGCEVEDEIGKKYIDYISGLGAISVGYAAPGVDDCVRETINTGQVLLSLPHPKETELARKLTQVIPCAEAVKFFKTGSEACSAAIRTARAYTGKEMILTCGYHGWHDQFAISYGRWHGIPKAVNESICTIRYNWIEDIEDMYRKGHAIAAIIVEPVVYTEPKNDFLKSIIAIAHKHESLVIFDEIVAGFRFDFGGIGGLYNILPDLACFGKAMGNGYPIAALVGKKEIMNVFECSDFFVSGTYGGDLVGISAALGVLETLKTDMLWSNGSRLQIAFNGIAGKLGIDSNDAQCLGYPPRTFFQFREGSGNAPALRALFWQECLKRGILFGYANFPTMMHKPLIVDHTASVMYDAMKIVKDNWNNPEDKLEGDLPKGVPIR